MHSARSNPVGLRLLREDAAGPISAVFAAVVVGAQGPQRVAVKLLRELPDGSVDHLFDLRDRARRIGALGHRHHACVTDLALVDARLALVSPYIDGIDLLDWMDVLAETGRILPRRVACEILRCTAVALEVAQAGMPGQSVSAPAQLHRDLKPTNIIIARDGELKVTDFATGYTSLAGRSAKSGVLKKGLVRYLSPERREGRRVAEAADIYALGILALELFRGKWLRRLRSQNPAHDRHLADVVARLEDLQMKSDSDERALRNLLLRMVAFDADARPAVAEVAAGFRDFADSCPGPSLESFSHAHAIPWLEDPTDSPAPELANISAVLLERGQPLPELGGDNLSVVTLPDRYDLQLASEKGMETGEWTVDEVLAEVTDPRLRAQGVVDVTDPEAGFVESAIVEDDDPTPPGPAPEAELWGDVTEPFVRPTLPGATAAQAATGPQPGRTTPLAQPTPGTTSSGRSTPPAPPRHTASALTHSDQEEILLDDHDLLGAGSASAAPVTEELEDLSLDPEDDTQKMTPVSTPPRAPLTPAPLPELGVPDADHHALDLDPIEITEEAKAGFSWAVVMLVAVFVAVLIVVAMALAVMGMILMSSS
ncbi:MAG: serine/threonine protein kinase [Myxococcota bacterium]